MIKNPSKYQTAIFDWIKGDHRALVVEALAGSGKTSTIVSALQLIPPDKSVLFVAFNKSIAEELRARVPANVSALTYHALGFSSIRKNIGHVEVNTYKISRMFEHDYPEIHRVWYPSVKKLVSLMKANLLESDDYNGMMEICLRHEIDTLDDEGMLFKLTQRMMTESSVNEDVIDFDDMCWFPPAKSLPMEKYDFVFVDEAQDTNRCQLYLAKESLKPNGRIVAVGDRHQSIYGFRGADVNAIPNLIDVLGADTLPLSISYRCPKAVVNLVRQKFPDIPIESSENAIQGEIIQSNKEDFYEKVTPGDMVLCRCNAPLLSPAFELLSRGIKASIRGKDIGGSLLNIIKKAKVTGTEDLHEKINAYVAAETKRYEQYHMSVAIQMLEDKRDCIYIIASYCNNDFNELVSKISSMFSDDIPDVSLSTVHKAKGLEANNVWIANTELMPHPRAKLSWERVQESNIEYVAITRSKNRIYYVDFPIRIPNGGK